MRLPIDIDQESEGRWIADVLELPGVMVYGPTPDAAIASARTLALRVLADRIEHGELAPADLTFVSFVQTRLLPVD